MAEKGYQGWKNYESWAVALWLDNDRGLYETAIATVVQAAEDAEREKAERKRWPRAKYSKNQIFAAADALKEWLEEEKPELGSPWAELLNSAFEEVNWYEIAEHFLEKE